MRIGFKVTSMPAYFHLIFFASAGTQIKINSTYTWKSVWFKTNDGSFFILTVIVHFNLFSGIVSNTRERDRKQALQVNSTHFRQAFSSLFG